MEVFDRFYEGAGSIFVEAYDAFYQPDLPQIAGDIAFYSDLARRSAGAVLEVACGTGRVTLPLAEAGLNITGVDCSEGMLSLARRKAARLPKEAQGRLTLIHQDMTTLQLDQHFSFNFVPFRSFQHLLTSDLQKRRWKPFIVISSLAASWRFTCSILVLTCWSTRTRQVREARERTNRRGGAM